MSNEIQIFANDQFGEVRTLTKDGEPWFVGKDVAQALGYGEGKSLANAVANHVDDEDKGVTEMMTPGGKQNMVIINESGLYSLILSSKLPTARAFKRWVTSEVLPAIRKHGEYTAPKVSQKRLGEVNSAARIIRQTLKEAGMAPQFCCSGHEEPVRTGRCGDPARGRNIEQAAVRCDCNRQAARRSVPIGQTARTRNLCDHRAGGRAAGRKGACAVPEHSQRPRRNERAVHEVGRCQGQSVAGTPRLPGKF